MLAERIVAVVTPAAWLAAMLLVQRYRRSTQGFAERAVFRSRLPASAQGVEYYVFMALFVALFLGLFKGAFALHQAIRHGLRPGDLAMVLIILSSCIGALVPAMLVANMVSWLVPSLRRANQAASAGLPTTTFRRANLGLAAIGAVILPLCAAQALLAAFEPWAR